MSEARDQIGEEVRIHKRTYPDKNDEKLLKQSNNMISSVLKRWLTALWKTDKKRIGREQLMGYCSSSNKRQMEKTHIQDDDMRGSWTHHLPRTHQIYRYIWNNSLRKLELLSATKERDHIKTGRRFRDTVSQKNPTWAGTTHKRRDLTRQVLLPEERGIGAQHKVVHALGSAPERWAPKTSSLENQRGCHAKVPKCYKKLRFPS